MEIIKAVATTAPLFYTRPIERVEGKKEERRKELLSRQRKRKVITL